jgi:preprotein translocase SecE subunit
LTHRPTTVGFLSWEDLTVAKKKETKRRASAPSWLKATGRVLRKVLIIFIFLRPIGRYFVGAWKELRQVKWPTRKASVQLTFAVIVFTIVMMGFIVLLDTGFEALVKKVIL